MCSPFTCGGFNIQEDDELLRSCDYSPPKISKRSTGFGSRRKDKNPYANRGLEKFYALLADLDEKRQKIYTQMGFEDVSLVRFVYSNSNRVKPIVVKVKEKRSQDHKANARVITKNDSVVSEKSPVETSKGLAVTNEAQQAKDEKSDLRNMKCCSICGRFKLEKFRQPYYYFLVVIMFILMLLAIFGRSFAIMCTSIGWYLIPTINGGSSDSSKPKKKKEYVKKVSEKKIVTSEGLSSPRSVLNGPKDKSPRQHG
ncbi:uncharacterized protein LOC111367413 [Olea europaea var. sylvestris]|uniref:ZCF37 n=1 Tax=Olea europaea subsp. europaea TaxID=158383 RepID=A0A8S0VNC4_OLEEU|nr:uncharacterized protein LOC111367413 [Olea europaea var. sylvestris]CAA3032132.1 Hypothetical predicted protein [Olea europaea subsp. europaea]